MSKSKIETPVRKVNPKLVMEGTLQKIKRNFPKNNGPTLLCVKFLTEHPKYADEFMTQVGSIILDGFKFQNREPTPEELKEILDNEIILDPSTHQPVESDGK